MAGYHPRSFDSLLTEGQLTWWTVMKIAEVEEQNEYREALKRGKVGTNG